MDTVKITWLFKAWKFFIRIPWLCHLSMTCTNPGHNTWDSHPGFWLWHIFTCLTCRWMCCFVVFSCRHGHFSRFHCDIVLFQASVELGWAMKASEHADVYYNVSISPSAFSYIYSSPKNDVSSVLYLLWIHANSHKLPCTWIKDRQIDLQAKQVSQLA